VKGRANRRSEGDRFKRISEALSYGAAERFRYGPETKEVQINRKMNEEGKRKT
jgi:hypothetical protein